MNTEAATGGLFFNKVAGLKETLAQLFSYEFCEIFKNSFFIEHLQNIASMNTCQQSKKKNDVSHSSFKSESSQTYW